METELNLHAVSPNEEELKQMHEKFLHDLKEDPNNISFWFPKVRDCGIRVPETIIVPVPDETIGAFFMEKEGDEEKVRAFVHEEIMPAVHRIGGLPFIKNASYSDKFTFTNCAPADNSEKTITRSVMNIQYQSACWKECYGMSEIVIRKRIPSPENLARIYGGMPLNTEFRVFYDFDARKALYVVNYWDKGYCREAISRNPGDLEAYDRRYPSLLDEYTRNAGKVLALIEDAFKDVTGLAGKWSADILLDQEGTFWLIDMALAHQSAYWDYGKAVVTGIDPERLEALFGSHEGENHARQRKVREDLFRRYRLSLDTKERDYLYRLEADAVWAWNQDLSAAGHDEESLNLKGIYDFILEFVPKTAENERLIDYMEQLGSSIHLNRNERETKNWKNLKDYLFTVALGEFVRKH